MSRLRTVLAGVVLTCGVAACGDSGGEQAWDDLSPAAVIRQAASQSGADSFRFVMEATQGPELFRGRGEFQGGATPALHQVMEMPGFGSTDFLVVGDRSWMKYGGGAGGSGPGLGRLFPAGKWIALDPAEAGMAADDLDFRSFLQSLFAVADVRQVGEADVDAVPTRHYAGTVTAAAVLGNPDIDEEIRKGLAEELRAAEGEKVEIEVWIDRDFRIRKFAQNGTDDDGNYRMTMALSDFGAAVQIAEPAKRDVVDQRSLDKQLEKQEREAIRRIEDKYDDEAELQRACRKLERRFQESFADGGKLPSAEDQALAMACVVTGPDF